MRHPWRSLALLAPMAGTGCDAILELDEFRSPAPNPKGCLSVERTVWIGGPGDQGIEELAVDRDGQIWVGGPTGGALEIDGTSVTADGSVYVVRSKRDGEVTAVLSYGMGTTEIKALAPSPDGGAEVVVGGVTGDAFAWPGEETLTPTGPEAAYVARVSNEGVTWSHPLSRVAGNCKDDRCVMLDDLSWEGDSIAAATSFRHELEFAPSTTRTPTGWDGAFASWDAGTGGLEEVRQIGNDGAQFGEAVAFDSSGSLLAAATTKTNSIDFDTSDSEDPQSLAAPSACVARYPENGNLEWSECLDDLAESHAHELALRGDGDAVVVGHVEESAILGALFLRNDDQALWSASFAAVDGTSETKALSVDEDDVTGDVVVGARFSGDLGVGTETLSTGTGLRTGVVLRLDAQSGEPVCAMPIEATGDSVVRGLRAEGGRVTFGIQFRGELTLGESTFTPDGRDVLIVQAALPEVGRRE